MSKPKRAIPPTWCPQGSRLVLDFQTYHAEHDAESDDYEQDLQGYAQTLTQNHLSESSR